MVSAMAPDICNGFDPEIEAEWRKILDAEIPSDVVDELYTQLEDEAPAPPRNELDAFMAERLRISERTLGQAAEETDARLRLHQQAREEIGYQILCCQASLKQFTGWGLGYNTGVDVKRNFLEKQLADLRRERRSLELRAFDDVRKLRTELREATADHEQTRYRLSLLEGGEDK